MLPPSPLSSCCVAGNFILDCYCVGGQFIPMRAVLLEAIHELDYHDPIRPNLLERARLLRRSHFVGSISISVSFHDFGLFSLKKPSSLAACCME
ncbi:hypothetical protein L195_g053073 [Trifolium pratense]|uniref:Uncharacterized protein n=1 Tax=Trifolium pratense TaxID=57577 RepID=A0A2K3K8K2_TRIPR|nr:hypothetical protein L195_g053073 [Trifolium pratense]